MRIVVSSSGEALNQQIRSYAEYRIFSALSMRDDVLDAHVKLRVSGDEVQCDVHVSLRSRGAIEARASASYAASAVDRAAARLAELIDMPRNTLST
jgi:ribosome-associated translation inhibitor RaiA